MSVFGSHAELTSSSPTTRRRPLILTRPAHPLSRTHARRLLRAVRRAPTQRPHHGCRSELAALRQTCQWQHALMAVNSDRQHSPAASFRPSAACEQPPIQAVETAINRGRMPSCLRDGEIVLRTSLACSPATLRPRRPLPSTASRTTYIACVPSVRCRWRRCI